MWLKIISLGIVPLVQAIIESVAKARRAKREQEARLAKEKGKAPKK